VKKLISKRYFILFFFFACPKEKEQKRKGSQSFGLPAADYPALLNITGRCETRGVYTPLRGAQTLLAL
jgi:hypothetical protein